MKHITLILHSAVLVISLVSPALAQWPQFRGPQGDGQADNQSLPLAWDEQTNITWKTPIHGRGWSSPVILGNQIWLTTATADGKQMFALCVDRTTGEIIHDVKLFDVTNPREIHKLNSYASPTPVIEQGRVYIHFGSYGTACLDTETGAKLWERRDLPCDHFRGPGSSPMLHGDKLIIHYDGFDVQYVVALNKQTGETLWKTDRSNDYGTENGDFKKAFCTPIVIEVDGREQLISPGSKAAFAYEPETGKEIWHVTFSDFSSTARPLYGEGLVFINTGFGKADLIAVDPTGTGDVTGSHVAWTEEKSIGSKPSQLLVDGLIYVIDDAGVASCLEAKTGEKVWSARVGGNFSASPIHADGKIYFCSQEGKTTVIAAGREFKVLAENELDAGFMASPAAADDALFLRTETHLYRIEKR